MKQARTIKEMFHITGLFYRALGAVFLFSAPGLFSRIIWRRSALKKKRIGLSGKSGKISVTLYTREKKNPRPVFIFVSGAKSFVQKSRQLSHMAKALAVIGYHVIIVDDTAYTGITITRTKLDILSELIEAVYQDGLFDKERIVLSGSDFSSRFLLKLINNSEMLAKIRCFLFLSPVVDVPALVKFAYTGRVRFGNRWV
ncbi:MAG: hypothetical protein JXR87_01640, partial [Candidatus Marinimicrobia bacterium]|nr:hypothetical protein [Candidatus Neomarinimicrobiota bacterium]